MSGWTRGSLFAALKATGVASILGWVLVLGTGPGLADPAPGDPGGGRGPLVRGRTRHRSVARRLSGRRGWFLPTARRWVWPSRSSSTSRGSSMTPVQAEKRRPHLVGSRRYRASFYWMTPTQLRWRPLSFWPAHTAVTVDAGGTLSSFQTGDSLVATADGRHAPTDRHPQWGRGEDHSHVDGDGIRRPPNPQNGTYYVQEKMPSVVMDSSTYGVPVNSTYGYKTTVELAVRFDDSGDFVHSAPWSVDDQGKARRQSWLHQHQPYQREMVLRQLQRR